VERENGQIIGITEILGLWNQLRFVVAMGKLEFFFLLAYVVAVVSGGFFSYYRCDLHASNKTLSSNYTCFIRTLSKTNRSLNAKFFLKRPVYDVKVSISLSLIVLKHIFSV
jgi:hypothetical protein